MRHWWYRARRQIIAKVLSSSLISGDELKILEIGCGSGGNLEMLSRFGDLSAIEMDDPSREAANERSVCEVRQGSLPDLPQFPDDFDLICMFDVLEHIEEDRLALQGVHQRLADRGKIFLTVPAFEFLWSALDDVYGHQRRYRLAPLTELVCQTGYRILYKTYFSSLLFPPAAAVRLVKRIFSISGNSDFTMPPAWMNRTLEVIFAAERNLIPHLAFPFGTSILLVGQKVG